jgi:two-component system OmpR family response regulator
MSQTMTGPARSDIPRILIADDEPSVREMLAELLNFEGYTVATAATGEEALQLLDRFAADVILLDILMPGLSGNETLSALRARGIEIPAIAITGMPDRASTGFLAVLGKPIEMLHLTQLLAVATRRGKSGR